MEKRSPLNIPEILSLIASFVPPWEVLSTGALKFQPRNLLSCMLVCKHWRQVMFPHLWAVYSDGHMDKVPTNLLHINSPYFRYFCQDDCRCAFIKLRHTNSLGQRQPLLRCTALKSFILSSCCWPDQLALIRANLGIVSLDWHAFATSRLPGTILNTVESFAGSLKTLRLLNGTLLVSELVLLLNHFSNLERLQLGANHGPLFYRSLGDLTVMTGVRIWSLKELTIVENIVNWNNVEALLSIFHQCPIEHIILHLDNYVGAQRLVLSPFQPLSSYYETVIAWKSRQSKAHHPMTGVADETFSVKAKTDSSGIVFLPQNPKGLEKLDIHLTSELCARFQNGCQDLVALTASINTCDPQVIAPLIDSHRRTLRNVDLTCGSNMRGYTAFEILGRLVGSLPELRRLKFAAVGGLSREESIATFKGGLWLEDQDDGSTLVTRTTGTNGWACRHLERLAIRGLWATSTKDLPEKGQDVITLQAASKNRQWVANGATRLGKHFRAVILQRLQTLPALNELTLGGVFFYYSEILAPAT